MSNFIATALTFRRSLLYRMAYAMSRSLADAVQSSIMLNFAFKLTKAPVSEEGSQELRALGIHAAAILASRHIDDANVNNPILRGCHLLWEVSLWPDVEDGWLRVRDWVDTYASMTV